MTGMTLIAAARSTNADPAGRPDRLPEGLHNPFLTAFLLGPDAVFRCGPVFAGGRGGGLRSAMRRTAPRRIAERQGRLRGSARRQTGQALGSRGCHDDIPETGPRAAGLR